MRQVNRQDASVGDYENEQAKPPSINVAFEPRKYTRCPYTTTLFLHREFRIYPLAVNKFMQKLSISKEELFLDRSQVWILGKNKIGV
jgi:hypothetical protein